jgi:hypothetical protein
LEGHEGCCAARRYADAAAPTYTALTAAAGLSGLWWGGQLHLAAALAKLSIHSRIMGCVLLLQPAPARASPAAAIVGSSCLCMGVGSCGRLLWCRPAVVRSNGQSFAVAAGPARTCQQ